MSQELSERQKQLKEKFIKERGYWAEETWTPILQLDEDFFETYLNFSAHPWKKGILPPKIREFIYIAIDAATTWNQTPRKQRAEIRCHQGRNNGNLRTCQRVGYPYMHYRCAYSYRRTEKDWRRWGMK